MSMPWFKFYGQDFLTDPKIKSLDPLCQLTFIYLLCLGSQNNGVIEHITEPMLAALMNINFDSLDGIFNRLVFYKLIKYDNAKIVIINYDKRQNSNLTGYERVKRFRIKKKESVIIDNTDDNADDNDRIDKIREDKNRIDNKQQLNGKKTNPLLISRSQELSYLKEFPTLTNTELRTQVQECNTYMGMSSTTYSNPGLFLRGWLKKYMSERSQKKANEQKLVAERKASEEPSEEQRLRNIERLDKMRAELAKKVSL